MPNHYYKWLRKALQNLSQRVTLSQKKLHFNGHKGTFIVGKTLHYVVTIYFIISMSFQFFGKPMYPLGFIKRISLILLSSFSTNLFQ